MISVKYHGRFGNNLFQYAMGRVLHLLTGLQMAECFIGQEHLVNCPRVLEGRISADQVSIGEHDYESIRNIAAIVDGRGIILDGFFQRAKYYAEWRDQIRQWFYLPPYPDRPGERDWVCHIRHGDYVHNNQYLPIEYYMSVIDQYQNEIDNLIIMSDDIQFNYVERLAERYPKLKPHHKTHLDAITDLRYMISFNNIVCSNSSYAWWGGFLSDATRVFIPQPQNKYWAKDWNQRLFTPNSNNILVEC